MRIILGAVITLVAGFFFLGAQLDRTVEQQNLLYNSTFATDGPAFVVQAIERPGTEAFGVLYLHGLGVSPRIASAFFDVIQETSEIHLRAPLLPGHGRELRALAAVDFAEIKSAIKSELDRAAADDAVRWTVIGASMSGAFLAELSAEGSIPDNLEIVLFAPGIFASGNTVGNRTLSEIYGIWRQYCNYKMIGCVYGADIGLDGGDRALLTSLDMNRTYVVPAIAQFFKLELRARDALQTLQHPVQILAAPNDHLIDVDQLAKVCSDALQCDIDLLKDGGHVLVTSKHHPEIAQMIIARARGEPFQCGPVCIENVAATNNP